MVLFTVSWEMMLELDGSRGDRRVGSCRVPSVMGTVGWNVFAPSEDRDGAVGGVMIGGRRRGLLLRVTRLCVRGAV